ncbi:SocA family protein [Candidatus Parcubacteria bacterium]|nr:SocA family protein [Candidatus Parcubacteria bacterium]
MFLELEKIKQSSQYFAKNIPSLYFTKFLKLLYYFDFLSVLERGKPVTNDTYYHLPYGPVPTVIKDQLTMLREENKNIEQELTNKEEGELKSIFLNILKLEKEGEDKWIILKDGEDIGVDYLSKYEKGLLDDIITAFKDTSTADLVAKTHQEIPYLQTPSNNIIDYKLAFYLKRDEILPSRTYPLNPEISQAEYFGR